jgi:hypothetical protein
MPITGYFRTQLITLSTLVPLLALGVSGCATAGSTATRIVMKIGEQVVIDEGVNLVHSVLDGEKADPRPLLQVNHTDATGVLVSAVYQIDKVDAISIKAVNGNITITGDGHSSNVTVAPGTTATIEIDPSHDAGAGTGPRALTFTDAMAGTWSGQLQQTDGRIWAMSLTIEGGSADAPVGYPEIPCAGMITMIGSDNSGVRAREHITSGSCTTNGTMVLNLVGGGRISVDYAPDASKYHASAILRRQ